MRRPRIGVKWLRSGGKKWLIGEILGQKSWAWEGSPQVFVKPQIKKSLHHTRWELKPDPNQYPQRGPLYPKNPPQHSKGEPGVGVEQGSSSSKSSLMRV